MTRRFLSVIIPLGILLLLVLPATASVVLSTVSFAPDAPLAPGQKQQVTATYAIVPAGSTTFARGHSLQMQTNLSGAAWNIQVTVDGRDAARQTVSGSVAFVNGEILSYPTTRDVGLVVTIDGTVPADASGSLTVLTVKELDNGGNAVPGSELAINQPVAGGSTQIPTTVLPTLTPPLVTTVTPKSTPAFAAPYALIALLAAILVLRSAEREP